MQEHYRDGTVGPVVPFDLSKMQKALCDDSVEEVKVFRRGSGTEKQAQIEWNKLSRNQKRRIRRRLLNRG